MSNRVGVVFSESLSSIITKSLRSSEVSSNNKRNAIKSQACFEVFHYFP